MRSERTVKGSSDLITAKKGHNTRFLRERVTLTKQKAVDAKSVSITRRSRKPNFKKRYEGTNPDTYHTCILIHTRWQNFKKSDHFNCW